MVRPPFFFWLPLIFPYIFICYPNQTSWKGKEYWAREGLIEHGEQKEQKELKELEEQGCAISPAHPPPSGTTNQDMFTGKVRFIIPYRFSFNSSCSAGYMVLLIYFINPQPDNYKKK